MRLRFNIVATLVGASLLLSAGCRSSLRSKLSEATGWASDSMRKSRGVWYVEADQTIHVGACPSIVSQPRRSCPGIVEESTPINLSEYELRLKQAVINFRAPGAPIVMSEPSLILMQAMAQLSSDEEARVAAVLEQITTSKDGFFDAAHRNYRFALAPFIPMGGAIDAVWPTKAQLLASSTTRKNLGLVTPAHIFKFDGPVAERSVVLDDGTVVTAVGSSIIWLKSGTKRYEFKTRDLIGSSPALLGDGTVVVSRGQKVYWLKNGEKRFEYTTSGDVLSSPAVLSDGTIVIGSDDHKVYWLKNGEKEDEFATGGPVRSSPAVLADDTVVIGSKDRKVYWLKDGEKKFEFETGDAVTGSAAILADGTAVVGSLDDHVYWLKDGVKRFDFKTGGDVRSSPAVLSDGSVVVGSDDYVLYWLKDGAKTYEFQGLVRSAPVVLSDDTIVVGVGISIHWLKNGISRFDYKSQGETYGSPVVLTDGSVVVGADNGRKFDNGRIFWLE
jgi:hypothetical protein